MTIDYDHTGLPPGVNENDLYIATWDENTDNWTPLTGSIVNKVNHNVSVQTTHFSRYSLFVYVPPPSPAPPAARPQAIPGGGAPPITSTKTSTNPPSILSVNLLGDISTVETGTDGTLLQSVKLTDPSENFILEVDRGGRIVSDDGTPVTRIEITTTEEQIPAPDNTVILGPEYNIIGYVGDSALPTIRFEPPAILTLLYDPKSLPENTFSPYVAVYTEPGGWVKLDKPVDSVFEVGKAEAVIYHASTFAVLADVAPPAPPLPAEFVVSNFRISPMKVQQDKPVSVTLTVENKGAVNGNYELYLIIDGVVQGVQTISLDSLSTKTISFTVSNLAPGMHQVKVAGQTGEFQVVAASITAPVNLGPGWGLLTLVVAVIIGILLIAFYLIIRKSRRLQQSGFNLTNVITALRGKGKE